MQAEMLCGWSRRVGGVLGKEGVMARRRGKGRGVHVRHKADGKKETTTMEL
jgi:hypothetical protein